MQKSILWAEDLEGHRQPSLYYLSDEEGADGPHLICDWNGIPQDFSETEFDTLTFKFKEHEQAAPTSPNDDSDNKETSNAEFIDYPNPAADVINGDSTTLPAYRQNDLDFAECAHLDFLSVPPMTAGLITRFVKHIRYLKANLQRNKTEIKKDNI